MQKSSLLKVISILFIIFGALSLLSSLGKFTENAAYGGMGIGTSVLALAAAALELAAGILGVRIRTTWMCARPWPLSSSCWLSSTGC